MVRIIKWIAFSLLFGLLPLGIKTGVLYFCGRTIGSSDVYSEVIFFDLVLNVGVISEVISLKKHRGFQTIAISWGVLEIIILAALYMLMIMISYKYINDINFDRMALPTYMLTVASVIGGMWTQIMLEVEK